MAKYSKKMMGKEVGSADVYAEPHTMSGKKVAIQQMKGMPPNAGKLESLNPSVGAISKSDNDEVKTSGIKIRGTGAATKGLMARGLMA